MKQQFKLYLKVIQTDKLEEKQKIVLLLTVAGNEALDVSNAFHTTREGKEMQRFPKIMKCFRVTMLLRGKNIPDRR